jgi:hypothetical protein
LLQLVSPAVCKAHVSELGVPANCFLSTSHVPSQKLSECNVTVRDAVFVEGEGGSVVSEAVFVEGEGGSVVPEAVFVEGEGGSVVPEAAFVEGEGGSVVPESSGGSVEAS